jgi:FkbH-like protein
MSDDQLRQLLAGRNAAFWPELRAQTERAGTFDEWSALSTLRRKAHAQNLKPAGDPVPRLRLAVLGGYTLYPLHELLAHALEINGLFCDVFLGDYDNYVSEITTAGGPLYHFAPEVIVLLPSHQRCRYTGGLTDPSDVVRSEASRVSAQLLNLCAVAHEHTSAEVILGNFILPARHDPGSFRARTCASDWTFRKLVNLELGLNATPFVQICDLEFLASRLGALAFEDPRRWFESKQLCAPSMMVAVVREIAILIRSLRVAPKKVLVLDLDNTLWGGVVAEDGLAGIEIGDTSARGEAFKAFQTYIRSLKQRGVLLAACSKNDHARAVEPFTKHPEMVLHLDDFVAFKANWEPKSDNLRKMAAELNLGLDSMVFVDDNPAEIEIVRQFAPAITTILLGGDPSEFVGQLQDCRLFEPRSITEEDGQRTRQYRAMGETQSLLASAADMGAYLESLSMEAEVGDFSAVDAPRLAQLINRSNQFNLTTRRRTESEVLALIGCPDTICFSVRLKDRFVDHGLISIVIGRVEGGAVEIDTWLMSCRVLKRQVEDLALNELARKAKARGCVRLQGIFLPTPKNDMVRDFYPRMGFQSLSLTTDRGEYTLDLNAFEPKKTRIRLNSHTYGPK